MLLQVGVFYYSTVTSSCHCSFSHWANVTVVVLRVPFPRLAEKKEKKKRSQLLHLFSVSFDTLLIFCNTTTVLLCVACLNFARNSDAKIGRKKRGEKMGEEKTQG
uniref:Uncharacterized protein n=1 Tax=Oryza brachyantha TaxID=4533 RepID=J3MC45_ORYBR